MVNGPFTPIRVAGAVGAALLLAALAGFAMLNRPALSAPGPSASLAAQPASTPSQPAAPPPIEPLPVSEALQSGMLIVISKGSQTMHVFKDGALWGTSPVSTGRRGHPTPAGMFAIIQKQVFHRSNIYSNAPMPHMQRLTWGGIAIHAGRLPGYPASHGCIRLPRAFARALYGQTRIGATTVVITNQKVGSQEAAKQLALATPMPRPAIPGPAAQPAASLAVATALPPRIETLPVTFVPGPAQIAVGGQTIQLAAASSTTQAEAHWAALVQRHPELSGYRMAVIPAVVGSRQVYRLRTTAPQAHALCASLKQAGEACFNVN